MPKNKADFIGYYDTWDGKRYNSIDKVSFFRTLRTPILKPDGNDSIGLIFKFTDGSGDPIEGLRVKFSVRPIFPNSRHWMRNEQQARDKFTARQWAGKKVLGTLNQQSSRTNAMGDVFVTYTSSTVGGDDGTRMAQEEVVANATINGSLVSRRRSIKNGIEGLRKLSSQSANNGVIFKSTNVEGFYMKSEIADSIEGIGRYVASMGWSPIVITEACYPFGGMIPYHAGHMMGKMLDCRPLQNSRATDNQALCTGGLPACPKNSVSSSNYSRSRTQDVVDKFFDADASLIYFNHLGISGTRCLKNHHNHLHVSWNSVLWHKRNPNAFY